MFARVVFVALVCTLLVACGQSSTTQSTAPQSPAVVISCTVQYAGHGIDTLNYSIICRLHGPGGAAHYTLTGKSPAGLMQYTWCKEEPLARTGLTTCSGTFVVIVPKQISTLTVTAIFLPGDEQIQTTVTVPTPSP